MPNQIQMIAPFWSAGTWVFDDPSMDLVQEPFVSGIPEMIDDLVRDIPNARQGFRLLFSGAPFPGFQRRLAWVREEMGGNWYRADEPPSEGWLCPALFHYFDGTPPELFVKAEPIAEQPCETATRSSQKRCRLRMNDKTPNVPRHDVLRDVPEPAFEATQCRILYEYPGAGISQRWLTPASNARPTKQAIAEKNFSGSF